MVYKKCTSLCESVFYSVPLFPDGVLLLFTLAATLCSVWDLYWLIERFRMIKLVWIVLPFDKPLSNVDEEQV